MIQSTKLVFLGGSCNPTTWRRDIAIPALEAAFIPYYNPQVDDWYEGLVVLEASAKEQASVLLFVIDAQTRAIASMLEATEYIVSGRRVVLVVQDMADGTAILDNKGFQVLTIVTGTQLRDLNRARAYLRDVAKRHNALVCSDVHAAIEAIKQM